MSDWTKDDEYDAMKRQVARLDSELAPLQMQVAKLHRELENERSAHAETRRELDQWRQSAAAMSEVTPTGVDTLVRDLSFRLTAATVILQDLIKDELLPKWKKDEINKFLNKEK